MALNRSILNERGESITYWKILTVTTAILSDTTEVLLGGYLDRNDRDNFLGKPKEHKHFVIPKQESITDIYNCLKTQPEFDGAVDC